MRKLAVRYVLLCSSLVASSLWIGCSGPQPPQTVSSPTPTRPEAHHPATFEAARALAVEGGVPLLVDFYSPT